MELTVDEDLGAYTVDSALIDEFTSLPPNDRNVPVVGKRGPGRPKGAKNKGKRAMDAPNAPAKRRGRPPGTGHLQRALAERLAAGEPEATAELSTRPVGRPPKQPPVKPVKVRMREPGERIHVKGVPDPTRQRHLAEAAAIIQNNNLGSVSVPTTPPAPPPSDIPHIPNSSPSIPPSAAVSTGIP
ncbi:hypothetical protein B0H12DRAFT_1074154 [Mycena haematopus]|nr:hypothetical protein B0H12DRAFT_1074154 [Mycena haematopus]